MKAMAYGILVGGIALCLCACEIMYDESGVAPPIKARKLEPPKPGGDSVAEPVARFGPLHFGYDGIQLDAASRSALERAAVLLKFDERLYCMLVGHTDAAGPAEYNEYLSKQRAAEARDYLVRQGVPAGRLQVSGLGETRPILGAEPHELRRVEVLVFYPEEAHPQDSKHPRSRRGPVNRVRRGR